MISFQYLLRSEIKYPHQYPWLEGEAFWNLTTNVHLSKDAFRPYLTNVLTIMFRGIYKYQTPVSLLTALIDIEIFI